MVFHNSLEFYIGGLYCISVGKIANNFTIAVSTIPPKLVFCYKEKKVVFLASFSFPKKKNVLHRCEFTFNTTFLEIPSFYQSNRKNL